VKIQEITKRTAFAVQQLDHATISSTDVDATVRFYEDVIGLRNGQRPYAPPGAWLYLGEKPVVHVVTSDNSALLSADVEKQLARSQEQAPGVDHIAFAMSGYHRFVANLRERHVPYEEASRPHIQQHQVFVRDPSGITIECVFDLAETR